MDGLTVPAKPQPTIRQSRANEHPEPLIIPPTAAHTHTFILLHGLGSNGEKFGREFIDSAFSSHYISLVNSFPGMKFIFPTAKKRRAKAFKRAMISQWFDMSSLEDPCKRQDLQVDGLAESAAYILSLLVQEMEMEMIRPENIILGGLSQGCAMGLFVLLGLDVCLGGFVGMSGWLPFRADIDEVTHGRDDKGGDEEEEEGFSFGIDGEERNENENTAVQAINFVRDILSMNQIAQERPDDRPACLKTPVFLGHGEKDEKVSCTLGKEAAATLLGLEMDVTWREYRDFGHWYKVPDEIDDIQEFLHVKVKII